MKKLLKYVLILLVIIMPFSGVTAVSAASAKKAKATTKATTTTTTTTTAKKVVGNPVNLYVFYGSTCSHCADLHTYLAELEEDEEYNYMFEVVDYEVWSNKDNATLMQDVASYLGTSASGVPFYVVGDFHAEGFPDISSTDASVKKMVKQVEDDLKAAIKKAYEGANAEKPTYTDIVASVGSGTATKKDKEGSDANDVIGYIILGITVIIIVAIIFGRSSSKDEEEVAEEIIEEEVEEIEEVKPETKKVAKKTTTKKATTAKKTTAKKSAAKKTSTSKKTTKKNK